MQKEELPELPGSGSDKSLLQEYVAQSKLGMVEVAGFQALGLPKAGQGLIQLLQGSIAVTPAAREPGDPVACIERLAG